jgi:GH35 family endo-1,4-beta-xylanase
MPQWEKLLPTLEWCRANGITAKGHPLVWPYDAGVPSWVFDLPAGSVDTLIKGRVINTVKGFEPNIQIWDVTNEAVNHISWREATQPEFKQRLSEVSYWRGIPVAGAFKREIPIKEAADWVEDSLRWAYLANPKATLIVNDYNQEIDLNVRQRFFELIRELQDRGAPVSGIGLQVHPVDRWIHPDEMWETLEYYRSLNVPMHITELHQPSWDKPIEGGYREGNWSPERQAEFMEQIYRLCFGHPGVASINYWGLSDRNIWIKSAGLIDEEYQPKPIFHTLKELIKGEWMTPAFMAKTSSDGTVAWRGFQGDYDVVVNRSGRRFVSQCVHVAHDEANRWDFVI